MTARIYKQTLPLPKTRKERIEVMEGLLAAGGVQKVSMDVKTGITVFRRVTEEDMPPGFFGDELIAGVRNSDIDVLEFESTGSALLDIYNAFRLASLHLSYKESRPATVLVRKWERPMSDICKERPDYFFGMNVQESEHIPEGVCVVVGTSPSDDGDVVACVRFEVPEGDSDAPSI